jgi:GTPase SAR1 family protein
VCDITRRETLDDLSDWIAAVSKVTGDVPVEFLANKIDLADQRQVTDPDVQAVAERHHAPFLFTSAKTGQNVEEGFAGLAKLIAAKAHVVA